MTGAEPHAVVFTLRGEAATARLAVGEFFEDRGWRVRERGEGRVDFESGSRRRTILLGAPAGRRFLLTAQISLRELGDRTEVRYRWGESAGQELGGRLGRTRARRAHRETAAALEQVLHDDGMLLSTRWT
ncbi:hypothetical protein [Brachybacterium sp. YJGR34]|uniref:hypothetical protein n=1 Tax=Brachybacterium sp. YJGR34 TaxID=2059911 RepID=UPI000E0B3230|nr:hypothetical protein [Brachybacterium sp. YJGR34]